MNHLLLEVFCECEIEKGDSQPLFCKKGVGVNGVHCFNENCKYLSYASVENEIAFVGGLGIVESLDNDCIGLGGNMIPDEVTEKDLEKYKDVWKKICIQKIDEAYETYMKKVSKY